MRGTCAAGSWRSSWPRLAAMCSSSCWLGSNLPGMILRSPSGPVTVPTGAVESPETLGRGVRVIVPRRTSAAGRRHRSPHRLWENRPDQGCPSVSDAR